MVHGEMARPLRSCVETSIEQSYFEYVVIWLQRGDQSFIKRKLNEFIFKNYENREEHFTFISKNLSSCTEINF